MVKSPQSFMFVLEMFAFSANRVFFLFQKLPGLFISIALKHKLLKIPSLACVPGMDTRFLP